MNDTIDLSEGKRYLVIASNYQCFSMWCHKYKISGYDRRVRYIRDDHDIRGYSPKAIKIVEVCVSQWNYRDRRLSSLADTIQYYEALGTPIIGDTCIPNSPTEEERIAAREERYGEQYE